MDLHKQDRHVNTPQIKLQGARDGFDIPVGAVKIHVPGVGWVCRGTAGHRQGKTEHWITLLSYLLIGAKTTIGSAGFYGLLDKHEEQDRRTFSDDKQGTVED